MGCIPPALILGPCPRSSFSSLSQTLSCGHICVNLPRGRRWGPRTGRERRALRERTCQRWHRSTNTHTYPHDCVLHTLQPTTGAPRWAACTSSQTYRCSTRLQATNRCRLRCAKGSANISRRGARTSRAAKPPPSNAKALALPPHFPPLWPSKGGMCFQILSELRDENVASFVHKQADQSIQHRRRIQQRRRLTCKLTKKSKHFSSLEIELCSVCQFTNGFCSS